MATLNNVIANANGCVGIGTSSPAQLLELKKTTGSAIALLNYNDSVKFNINASSAGAGYVGMVTNHDLIFVTNDTERARLNINGNLGIGTTSPTRKLHIDGGATTTVGIYIDANGISGTDIEQSSDAFRFQIRDNIPALFYTNNAERIRITSGGNVGIGTSSPSTRFHVYGTGAGFEFGVNSPNCYIETIDRASVGKDLNTGYYTRGTGSFTWNNGSYTERMRIDGGGNVGIGTTSPAAKLDIVGTNTTIALSFGTTVPNNPLFINTYGGWSGIGMDSATAGIRLAGDYSATPLVDIGYYSGGSVSHANWVNRMRVQNNGNVGIGTTSPGARLHVTSSASTLAATFQGNVGVGNLAGYYYGLCSLTKPTSGLNLNIMYASLSSGYGEILMSNYNDNTGASGWASFIRSYSNPSSDYSSFLTFGTSPSSLGGPSERMRITAAGYVGIGTSNTTPYSSLFPGQLVIESGTSNVDGIFSSTNNANAAELILTKKNTTNNFGSLLIQHAGTSGDAIVINYSVNTSTGVSGTNSFKVTTGGDGYFKGNVGIGTTSPTAKLYVVSSGGPIARFDGSSVASSGATEIDVLGPQSNGDLNLGIGGSTFTDDTNNIQNKAFITAGTGLSGLNLRSDAGYVQITAGGVASSNERMRITSDGKVGIGTSSPVTKFQVSGSATIGGYNTFYFGTGVTSFNITAPLYPVLAFYYGTNLAGIITGYSDHIGLNTGVGGSKYISFEPGDSEIMRITAAGNVGIGTSSPTAKLQTYATNTGAQFLMSGADGVNSLNFGLGFSVNSQTFATIAGYYTNSGGSGAGDITFYTKITSTALSEKMRIQADGNVGIGTTSPVHKLHVYGSNIRQIIESSTDNSYILMGQWDGSTNRIESNVRKLFLTSYTNGIGFGINGSENMTLNTSGNLGIGTTSPTQLLEVNGTSPIIRVLATSGNSTLRLTDNGVRNWDLKVVDVNDYFEVGGTSATSLVVTGAGNVGIGTTTTTGLLTLNGTYPQLTANNPTTGSGVVIQLKDNGRDAGFMGHATTTARLQFGSRGLSAVHMTIGETGNVGIGTTSPAYKFEVNGSLYATRLSGSAMFTTNGKGRFYGTASYALASAGGGGSSLTGQTDSASPFETSLGHQAGNSNTGTGNTAVGYQALFSNTTGTGSIAIGYQALYSNTRGKRNIAIGYEALRTTQGSTDAYGDPIGDENVAIGYQAARAAFNINRVVAIGYRALAKNRAEGNVAIGWLAMESNVGTAGGNSGVLNTGVGTLALSENTSGNANSAFGYLALNSNTTGNENTAVGHRSMVYNSTGKNNCSFGSYALYYNQIANNNSAFGTFALYSNTTNNNSAFGYKALRYNTTGYGNNAFGYQALYSNISGKGNSAFGFQALKYATTATGNSAFGRSALSQCSGGARNSAFGYYSSGLITGNPAFGGAGMDNCSFGYRSLYFNNSGNNNTAVGKDALYNNKVSNQTAIGYNALTSCTTGNGGNTAVGSNAGTSITFGYRNTMIGNSAGSLGAAPLTTGQNNTCLGNGAITSTATVSNEITLGNSSITTLRCQVTTITSLSDIRDKDDIIPVDVGLSFIEKLRPVTFKWDKREWYTDGNRDGSKKDTITQIGFIAQELKALQESENATYLNLVYESNPDKLEATPGNLMVPLIKAVQELSDMVKQQRVEFNDKITQQQLEIDYLKSKLNN